MKFISAFFAVALLTVSSAAFANGSQTNQLITAIQTGQDLGSGSGRVLLFFAQNAVGSATCVSTSGLKYFAIDATTAQGRAAISLAELALATGRTIFAEGAGQCTLYGGVEDLGFMYTTD
jgi:hypothetical protein